MQNTPFLTQSMVNTCRKPQDSDRSIIKYTALKCGSDSSFSSSLRRTNKGRHGTQQTFTIQEQSRLDVVVMNGDQNRNVQTSVNNIHFRLRNIFVANCIKKEIIRRCFHSSKLESFLSSRQKENSEDKATAALHTRRR